MNARELSHIWAHQLRSRMGGSRDSLTFEGTKIKSYNTVIGDIVDLPNGNRLYFLNIGRYSSTTAKHQSYVRQAIPTDGIVFGHNPVRRGFEFEWGGVVTWYNTDFNKYAISWIDKRIYSIMDELKEFKDSRTLYLETRSNIYKDWNDVLRFIQVTKCTTVSKLLKRPSAEWTSDYGTGCHNLTVVRMIIRALVDKTELKDLVDMCNGAGTYDEYFKRTKGARTAMAGLTPEKLAERRRKAAQTKAENELKRRIERQLQGVPEGYKKIVLKAIERNDWSTLRHLYHESIININNVPYNASIYRGGNVLMRYNPNSGYVETTKGIRLSVGECQRLWVFVKRWHENQSSFQAGQRAVSTINNSGWDIRAYLHDILHAGCHSIAYGEMYDLAVKLGIV